MHLFEEPSLQLRLGPVEATQHLQPRVFEARAAYKDGGVGATVGVRVSLGEPR